MGIIMIGEIWEKLTLVLTPPMVFGFVVLAIMEELCFDNLPYLIC